MALEVVEAKDRFKTAPTNELMATAKEAVEDLERAMLRERLDGQETYPEYVLGAISSTRSLLERWA